MRFYGKSTKELINEWKPVMEKYGVIESKQGQMACILAGTCNGRTAEEVIEELKKVAIENEKKTPSQLAEANVSGDVAQWTSVAIPMITRAIPGVIGPEIFGFQPTSTPNALIFYMTRHYTNDSANAAKPASSKILVLSDASAFAVGDACTGQSSGATGIVRYKEGNTILVGTITGTFTTTENLDDANPFSATAATLSAQYDTEVAHKVAFADYNAYASVALAEAATTTMKEVELKIASVSVTVGDHQIKVKWTRQMEYDLRMVHGKDAEAILSNAAAQEFAHALNQKMLSLVRTSAVAGGNTNFNYTSADGRWEVEKYQNLLAAINRVSAQILVDNKFGEGNFLIMDPVMYASLDTMGLIDKSMLPGGMNNAVVSPFCGVLLGRYRVYVDIFQAGSTSARYIYIGFKDFSNAPDAEMKAGYFLSIYKAIDSIKVRGEDDGHPRKIFESRYALTANPFGAENFFRMITVSNFPG